MRGWQNSFGARVRNAQWRMERGLSVLNPRRPFANKSSVSRPPTAAMPGTKQGDAAASPLPAPVSPSGAGTLQCGQCADARTAQRTVPTND